MRAHGARTTITPTPRCGSATPIPTRSGGWANSSATSSPTTAVNDEYKHVVLQVHEHALTAYAGQMFHLLCPSPDGAEVWMRRPMSVYRVDKANGQIEFLYKTEGRGTRGMAMLTPGDDFNVAGPLGVGFKLEPGWKNIVVLGRGVGLATLAPLSQLAAEHGVGVTAILSARHADVVMSKRAVRRTRREHHNGAQFRRQQRGRERRDDHRGADRRRARPTPSSPAARTAC